MGFIMLITSDTSAIFQRRNDKRSVFTGHGNNNKQRDFRRLCLKSILGDLWRPLHHF